MKSIVVTSEQRTYLYRVDRGLWRKMLALMRNVPRLEYPRDEVKLTGPADLIDAMREVLYGTAGTSHQRSRT